jgi:hypothetical protein
LKKGPQLQEYHQVFERTADKNPSSIVQTPQNKKLTLRPRLELYIGKTIQDVEREAYKQLLLNFKNVFVWSNNNLTGTAPKYGEHIIDLKEKEVPIR